MDYEKQLEYLRTIAGEKPIILFGAKYAGFLSLYSIKKMGITPVCFCDNNAENLKEGYIGLPVLTIKEAKAKYEDAVVIVCLFNKEKLKEVCKQLNEHGFENSISCELLLYNYVYNLTKRGINKGEVAKLLNRLYSNKNYLTSHETILFTTLRCTLNCKDCISLVPYFKGKKHYPKEEIVKSALNYLDVMDGVVFMPLFGGEPLMHPNIAEICEEITASSKLMFLELITNATLVPKIDYQKLKDSGVVVRISDYHELSKKKHELIAVLEEYDIPYYYVDDTDLWYKMPYPTARNLRDEAKAEQYKNCFARHNNPTIINNKYYECTFCGVCEELDSYTSSNTDSVDLQNTHSLKERLTEYIENTKFLNCCDYCNFIFNEDSIVKRGEQAGGTFT